MAKNMQPIAKRCKALGISPAVMGYAKKETNRNPGGQHPPQWLPPPQAPPCLI